VEKTPKKFQRTYTANSAGPKYSRGGAKGGSSATDRTEKFQRTGKRVGQPKWKRRGIEKQEESVPRKRKVNLPFIIPMKNMRFIFRFYRFSLDVSH
jgi:hypothetical protein